MKLLHHLTPIILAACGTTSSDDDAQQGCTSDSDCKSGRICLEGICAEAQMDAAAPDSQIADAEFKSPYQGTVFAIAEKNGAARELVFVEYDLSTNLLQHLTDRRGSILTAPAAEEIFGVTRPALSPEGTMIAFATHQETRHKKIYGYNLRTGDLHLISERGGIPAVAWIDEERLLYTQEELHEQGTIYTTLYKRDIGTSNSIPLVSLPLDGYIMGLAYDHDFAIFSCPTQDNLEHLQSDPENRAYQRPIKLCGTRVSSNNTEREDDYFHFGVGGFEVGLVVFLMGGKDSDVSYDIFFACKNSDAWALCKANIESDIEKVMDVRESFHLGAFDPTMQYAFLNDGRVLHLKDKEEKIIKTIRPDFEGEKIIDFLPFAYRK